MAKPWYTSDELVTAVKRKIMFPEHQVTFDSSDILAFANEEMVVSMVPTVNSYHEEYLIYTQTIPLRSNISRYPFPKRAMGMKLRDIFYTDSNGNLFEMTRISPDDKAYFTRSTSQNIDIYKFYIENNDIVLVPNISGSPSGSLILSYIMRPNQLVPNERAAIISSFGKTLTVVNSSLIAGDTLTISYTNTDLTTTSAVFTAVSGSPSTNEFQIGASSEITATNIVTAINTNGIISTSNGSPATSQITCTFSNSTTTFVSSGSGIVVSSLFLLNSLSVPTTVITSGSLIDILETDGGHKTLALDITPSNISTTSISIAQSDVPINLVVGDYICLAQECIIPQIPSDFHTNLADRTCARILAAIGDYDGLNSSLAKIQDNDKKQSTLIDNRVEGAPQKIQARRGVLGFQLMGPFRRRYF